MLVDRDRTVTETLSEEPAAVATPVLIEGTGPQSFHDAKPEFVFFDANNVACRHAVPDPLPAQVAFEHQGDAYYASLSRPASAGDAILALRLQTPGHGYQYIRMPAMAFAWSGWPKSVLFNVKAAQMSELSGKATDILFCPPLNVTAAS